MPRIGLAIRDVYRRPGVDALPAHLEEHYGIRVVAVTKLDAGVLRIDHDGGPPWVARAFVRGRAVERARDDALALRRLEVAGVPAERCATPEPVSELDGRAVLVTDFVVGGRIAPSAAARRRAGDLLGRVHTLEGGPDRPAGSLHHLPQYEGAPGQDLAAAAAMLDDVDGRVPPKHTDVYGRLRDMLPFGDGCDGLPESFVHPDPARPNLIAGPAGRLTLVDWTGAGRGPRLASLAVLLTGVGAAGVADVMRGYRAHVQLTPEELDRVEGALWIRPLWLACWQLWLAAVSSKVSRAGLPEADRVRSIAAALREDAARV